MKKHILFSLLILGFALSAAAQKINKPTLVPAEPTVEQKQLIEEGTNLHDEGDYDGAIAKYSSVIRENPSCVLAIYERALSLYYKKDLEKALIASFEVTKYTGQTGVLGYGLIANIYDDQGKSNEAVKIYQSAIKQLANEAGYKSHLASLHYNLGITYAKKKKYPEARIEVKKAVEYDFSYASANSLLSELFSTSRYKVPAMLAAARLVSLEINSQRSKRAAKMIVDSLDAAEVGKDGGMTINLDFVGPKDEGEFGAIEMLMGTLTKIKTDADKGKSDNEMFADAIDSVISLLSEDKSLRSTFVGKNYIPFMAEMKQKGYVKHFAYLVLQQNGDKDAEKWLIESGQSTIDFLNWARSY